MTRTVKPVKQDKLEIRFANLGYPKGGMTPYPPEDCPAPRFSTNEQGTIWCDNQFCVRECTPNYCTPNRRYRKFIYRKLGKVI